MRAQCGMRHVRMAPVGERACSPQPLPNKHINDTTTTTTTNNNNNNNNNDNKNNDNNNTQQS